jgi:hypothetical protein
MDSKRMIQPIPGKHTKIPVFKSYVGDEGGSSMSQNMNQGFMQRMPMQPMGMPPIGLGFGFGMNPMGVVNPHQAGANGGFPANMELPKGPDGNPITTEQLMKLFPHLAETLHGKLM